MEFVANCQPLFSSLLHGDDKVGGSQGSQLLDGSRIGRKFDCADVGNDSRTHGSRYAVLSRNHPENHTRISLSQREKNHQ